MQPLIFTLILMVYSSLSYPSTAQPKRVLFTTPAGYASRMQQALDQTGVVAVSLPMIETTIERENERLSELVEDPGRFDWIVFSSRKAIEAFAFHMKKSGTEPETIAKGRYCAIGKDAEYMERMLRVKTGCSA